MGDSELLYLRITQRISCVWPYGLICLYPLIKCISVTAEAINHLNRIGLQSPLLENL